MLTGPSLSPVQFAALHVLDNEERSSAVREEVKGEMLGIKLSILGARPRLGSVLFPQWLGEGGSEPAEPPPTVEVPTEDEVREMEEWINQATRRAGAEMTGAEMYGDDEGWQ